MIEIGHLDLNIVEHCTHRCVSCSHASPILPKWNMPLEMIERDLLALKPFLKVAHLQLVGGEPTLHPEIVSILELTKSIRIDRCTSVITNGSLLDRMPEEFWQNVEYLQISIYPGKTCHVELAREKSKQYNFGLGESHFDQFHRQIKPVPDDGEASFRNCHWKHDCFTVHRGYFHLCPQSTFFPKALMYLPASIDGLPLDGIDEQTLDAFMHRSQPFNACRICRANEMKPAPWQEAARAEWIQTSTNV
jgi:cyclic pyranopterin phosphate synthase